VTLSFILSQRQSPLSVFFPSSFFLLLFLLLLSFDRHLNTHTHTHTHTHLLSRASGRNAGLSLEEQAATGPPPEGAPDKELRSATERPDLQRSPGPSRGVLVPQRSPGPPEESWSLQRSPGPPEESWSLQRSPGPRRVREQPVAMEAVRLPNGWRKVTKKP